MKKNNQFEIERCCARCEHATLLNQLDAILCNRKGIVCDTHVCRHFIYDPLKRTPKRLPTPPQVELPQPEEVEMA